VGGIPLIYFVGKGEVQIGMHWIGWVDYMEIEELEALLYGEKNSKTSL
jgi:hypothetical protein